MKPTGDHDKWIPDIINLYSNGEQTQISKISNEHLFERVLRLIVFEKEDMMSRGNPPIFEEDITEMNGQQ